MTLFQPGPHPTCLSTSLRAGVEPVHAVKRMHGHHHLRAQAHTGKVLLHSGRISHCLKQVSHHGNLFLYSYLILLLNILANSIMGTNEISKSKQKGDNVAQG